MSKRTQWNHRNPYKRRLGGVRVRWRCSSGSKRVRVRETVEDAILLALKLEEGAMSREMLARSRN